MLFYIQIPDFKGASCERRHGNKKTELTAEMSVLFSVSRYCPCAFGYKDFFVGVNLALQNSI